MTRGVTVELDSFRLPQFADEVPCLICREGNLPGAEFCRNCFAPMVLAHQAQSRAVAPCMFVALGPSGVGKTVYLGMLLDMLARQAGDLHLSARGGFSVALAQNTLAALTRREFPAKTPNEPDRWNWVHAQLHTTKRQEPIDVVLPDIAGESLQAEVQRPRSYQVLSGLLSRSHGALILIDGSKLQSGSLDEDYFAMKVLSHLAEARSHQKPRAQHPVAIVVSKADQCETAFDSPDHFVEAHAPGVWRICRKRFTKHRFFAASVAGACARRNVPGSKPQAVPLRIEPRGIVEPFRWLVDNLSI